MAVDWQMPRRSDRCCVTGRVFEIGESFWVVLRQTPAGYERADYALDHAPADTLDDELARWRTRRPEPKTQQTAPTDRAALLKLFQSLDADEPQHVQLRFVLALLLWRKKVLNLTDTEQGDAGEWWVFRRIGEEGEMHRVLRPELDETAAEQLGAQLESLLAGEIPLPEDSAGEPAADETPASEEPARDAN